MDIAKEDDSGCEPELKFGSRARVSVLDENDEEEFVLGTYQGAIPIETVLDNPSLLDFPVPEMHEIEKRNPELADHLKILIENGEETEEFLLDDGRTIYGFQCLWEMLHEPPPVLH